MSDPAATLVSWADLISNELQPDDWPLATDTLTPTLSRKRETERGTQHCSLSPVPGGEGWGEGAAHGSC